MEPSTVYKLIETLGFPIVVALFFMWWMVRHSKQAEHRQETQDKKEAKEKEREDKEKAALIERLAAVEDYQRTELQKIVIENTTALQNHADASKEMSRTAQETSKVNKQVIIALETRPCLEQAVRRIQQDAS